MEEDESHHSGSQVSGSQLSLASHEYSQHSQQGRSRNDSEMSDDLRGSQTGSAGPCFFADMTLDLSMAQMETTPRTDMKFASMANKIQNIPSIPAIEEPDDEDAASPSGGMMKMVSDVVDDNHDDGDDDYNDVDIGNSVEAAETMATTEMAEQQPERSFARIESGPAPPTPYMTNQSSHSNLGSSAHSGFSRPTRTPRRPRDVSWTAAALLVMPLGLLVPHLYYPNGWIDRHNHRICGFTNSVEEGSDVTNEILCEPTHPSWSHAALSPSTHSTILFSSLAATAISLVLLRLLYSHPGGGEGDDQRHVNVTRTLLLASRLCVWLNPLLAVSIWHFLPNVRAAIILPLGLMMRDVFRVKNSGSSLPRSNVRMRLEGSTRGRGLSPSSSHDRKTFFRALAVASLDILSRSLRRKSFVRAASALLLVQFATVSLWWGALSVVLSVEIFEEDGVVTKFMHVFWLLLTLVAGKWATGTIARLLGFVASGGVASWFARQTVVIERMEREVREEEARQRAQRRQRQQSSPTTVAATTSATGGKVLEEQGDAVTEESSGTSADDTPASNYAAARAALHAMPEAYRSADASAYASVMDFDEGLDDDYEEDDVELVERGAGFLRSASTGGGSEYNPSSTSSSSTVKSFLTAGCTISLGSVAQCGLTGGLAQFLWSLVRNVDAMGFFLQRRFGHSSGGFRGMQIGGDGRNGRWKETLAEWWRGVDAAIRGFVRSHSDLAMSHVAAYYKGYQRAANDVAVLIETSGLESVIHDDITTHMCSSAGHLVAGSIVLVLGALLVAHRNSLSSDPLGDASVFEVLLFSYVLCHTILFTATEPLRSAIKAVYVCFAEHPASLGQAFPLIYQRLSRISGGER